MEFVDATKDGQDKYVGFDLTLARYFAEQMGLELVTTPMSFDACQTAVAMGTVDMALSGFSWTEERAENYNLSDYYRAGDNEDEQILITLAGNEGLYDTAEKLAGLKVGAQTASLQESLCQDQLADSELVIVSGNYCYEVFVQGVSSTTYGALIDAYTGEILELTQSA
jgi:polar amino acid transport system substrate-binding protein